MSWRDRIAHAVTPWEWRTRRSVVTLVGVAIAATIGGVVVIPEPSLFGGVRLVFGLVAWVWPSVRALRRWDRAHDRTT